ncbi:MAG: post-COAP-1 domain-containing protein [Candidatus Bathyarchaeota archaeon]
MKTKIARLNHIASLAIVASLMALLMTQPVYACGGTPGKVTGGGQIPTWDSPVIPAGSFGFNIMFYPDKGMVVPKGELEFIDHTEGWNVHGHDMTSLVVVGPPKGNLPWTARFEGECTVNGEEGFRFVVWVEDWGEPGKNDIFQLEFFKGAFFYCTGPLPTLLAGNIQIHKK